MTQPELLVLPLALVVILGLAIVAGSIRLGTEKQKEPREGKTSVHLLRLVLGLYLFSELILLLSITLAIVLNLYAKDLLYLLPAFHLVALFFFILGLLLNCIEALFVREKP